MRKLVYLDTYSTHHMHEMFNASSLVMFSHLYDRVDYYASYSSIYNVKKIIGTLPANIYIHSIYIVNTQKHFGKIRRFLKQIQATLLNVYFIRYVNYNDDIVINYMTAISLYPINIITNYCKRRVLIVCHSDIQEVLGKHKVSYLFKKSIRMLTNRNVKIASSLWFAVLSESILINVKGIVSNQVKEKLVFFDHTAIFQYSDKIEEDKHNSILKLGYIGELRQSKGADTFLTLAKKFRHNPHVEFRIIGSTKGKRVILEEAGVIIPNGVGDDFISRELMYSLIKELDYVIYCFPPEDYKYTASGSIFDAIDCERPIIAIKNDYFDGLFNSYGHFGFLAQNEKEIAQIIASLLKNPNMIKWDIKAIKQSLSPLNAAKRFSSSKWFTD